MTNLFLIALLFSFTSYSQTSAQKNPITIYKRALDSIKADTKSIYNSGAQTTLLLKELKPGTILFKALENTTLSAITLKALSVKEYSYTDNLIKNARYRLITIAYKTSPEADLIYKEIKKVALEKSGIPGLTYTNDLILIKENKIYWFNSNCIYSEDIHYQLSFAVVLTANINFIESIKCDCGKVICEEFTLF